MEERNGKKQENEVSRMNFLTKIKNWLEKEINTDWRIVALDLNQDNNELRNQMKALIQENVDLRKNLQMYKEKENV